MRNPIPNHALHSEASSRRELRTRPWEPKGKRDSSLADSPDKNPNPTVNSEHPSWASHLVLGYPGDAKKLARLV